jgi:hypothetical protein
VTVNLVLFWDWQMEEPWYLATSLGQPHKAIRCYARRMGQEEMFRDDKHHLGLRGMQRVQSSARKERLLFALMLVYLLLALLALKVIPKDFAKQVISWGKASFLFLALEWVRSSPALPPKALHLLQQ